jgi:predicted Na+-dependent transporter
VQDWETIGAGIGPALPLSLGLCVLALAAGYGTSRLVGLSPVDSATVAIEGSIRNLAVAFVIAANVLGRIDIAVLPSVYFMAVLIVGLTFARFWRTKMAPRYIEEKIQ